MNTMLQPVLAQMTFTPYADEPNYLVVSLITLGLLLLTALIFLASRYKRCPSDRILVVYGRVGAQKSARCMHGGGVIVWPLIQDYGFLHLTPMTIAIPLQNALSRQNIRVNVPSTFTIGVSTDPAIMTNAAERLLGIREDQIEEMAKEIIFGQLRLTVASLTIEQINQDRESFLEAIRKNVEPELNKIGLSLLNVNITDITDESNYIESIGKKAASEAINQARIDVSVQEKLGAIGQADANREKDIRVAESVAAADKGQKKAEADRRVFVQAQEAEALIGESTANRDSAVRTAENLASAEKGKKKAEADRRVYVQEQEAEAVQGENKAQVGIATSNAELAVQRAVAFQRSEVAKLEAMAEVQKSQARAELERLNATEVVKQDVERRKVEIAAEAEAEKIRREARGNADAVLMKYEAEARGIRQVLESKAAGYLSLVESCKGDARAAATFLLVEKMEDIVAKQVEAIKNIKIDKVVVWDGGQGEGSSTASFVSGLVRAIPPLQDVAKMAGVELPEYLGRMAEPADAGKRPPA
ncbi:MAG: SPFH domain-containing protein [Kiritimatiellia bacterium]